MPTPEVNNVWAKNSPSNEVDVIPLPSGQVVHARRIGLETLVRAGIVGEADQLTMAVQEKHFKKSKNQDQAASAMMRDPKAFGILMEVMDRALPMIVVKPKVALHMVDLAKPAPDGSKTRTLSPEEREDGVIYTDQVPFADKVELINYGIGGLASLDRFREQPEGAVAAVVDGEELPSTSVGSARNRAQRRSGSKSRSVRR